ncbi:MAG: metal ABC transporter substrate-binding protein [Christensenellaceae bacterium]|jgi:zinc transport system substrate-binding protein|nr:metal ABC transporter substrate-binding protein [Christensenellaceae bacterium]
MKLIKLTISIVILMAMSIGLLSACSPSDTDKLSIVVTCFPAYDFARAVAKNNADITLLLSPGSDVHSYEPTVSDISKIIESDIYIYIGGESDSEILPEEQQESITESGKAIRLMDYVVPKEEELKDGMQGEDEEAGEEEEAEYDEHIWMSIANAIEIIKKIEAKLSEVDSENTESYKTNAADYIAQLTTLKSEYKTMIDAAPLKKIVVADRFPFRYLVDEFDLDYSAALVGCAHDADIAPTTIAYLIQVVKAEQIPYVYYVELSDNGAAATIAEETGCQTAKLNSCERPTQEEFDAGVTYLSIMKENLNALKLGLYPNT